MTAIWCLFCGLVSFRVAKDPSVFLKISSVLTSQRPTEFGHQHRPRTNTIGAPPDEVLGQMITIGDGSGLHLSVQRTRAARHRGIEQSLTQSKGDGGAWGERHTCEAPREINQRLRSRWGAAQQATAYSCHSSGTPLREWTPLSVKSSPEPVVRSLTVRLARTSPGPAKAAIRAAI